MNYFGLDETVQTALHCAEIVIKKQEVKALFIGWTKQAGTLRDSSSQIAGHA